MKPRHHLYLDDDLTAALEALAARPGASKSAIVTDALRQYLKNQGGNAQDQAVLKRLDQISRQNAQTRRDMEILYNVMAEFVKLYLATTAQMKDPDDTAQRIAHSRFETFYTKVGQAMAHARGQAQAVIPSTEDHRHDATTGDMK